MIYRLSIDAFHASPEVADTLEQVRGDRILAKSRVNLHPGGLAAAVDYYRTNASPQVVIVEEDGDEAALSEHLGQLAEVCVAHTRVLVIGRVNDVGLYRLLLSQGVSEYFVHPANAPHLVASIESLFGDPSATPRGRLITFFGARGGVGSSTLAHNTGWALAESTGEEVVLVDLDLAFGTLALAYNMEARQTVGELLGEPERIDAQLLDRLLIKQDDHLQLLPSPTLLKHWPAIDPEVIDKLLDLVRRMAGYVVVDLPHAWAPWVSHAMELADDLVIVAQPDLPNLRDTKALLEDVGQRRGDRTPIHLVLNKQDAFKRTQLTAKDFEETLKRAPALSLPFDPVFGEACNNGQMIGQMSKSHRVTELFRQLAGVLSRRPNASQPRRSAAAPAKDILSNWLKKAKLAKG